MDALLPPPDYGYLDAPVRPDFVLLKNFAYLADRDNATTASCGLRGPGQNGSIKVTFCPAAPPHVSYLCAARVSYLCVHASAYGHTDLDLSPTVLATEGPLVLLCAVLSCPSDMVHPSTREYSVYHAAGPSLEHLPSPGYLHRFLESSAALLRRCLRHGDGASSHDCEDVCHGYVVVATKTPHELSLYHSETGAWTVKRAAGPRNAPYYWHCTHRAFAIGGDRGVVAWVDLDRGILLCDALAESPTVHGPVRLPPLMPPSEGVGTGNLQSAAPSGSPSWRSGSCRDPSDDGSVVFNGWRAATWSMPINGADPISIAAAPAWCRDYKLDSGKIYEPKVQSDAGTAARPTLRRLHTGLPVRSLRDDGVVYLLRKIDYRDSEQTARVLAVDMEKRTVQGVAEFGAGNTIGLGQAYIASDISKYLKM